jgi:DNA-binding transcriptional ArsR family regulator
MKAGSDIARIASLVGEPARANMLTAQMRGGALTASELAHEAGVTLQTASSHLAKLESGGLVTLQRQGRHRYFRLSGPDVPAVLEALMGLAARAGHLRTRPGPKDPALRRARVCYDHLAGDLGVELFDSLLGRRLLATAASGLDLTPRGERFMAAFGIDVEAVRSGRRPLCKPCLDWSARRSHLAGSLGAALLARCFDLGWAQREGGTRIVRFSRSGEAHFADFLRRAA